MELLQTYKNLYGLRYCPISMVQIVFATGTVFLLGAIHATTGLRVAREALRHAQSQAEICVQYLLEMGRSWECATNIAEILRRLMNERLQPWLQRGLVGVEVTPEPEEESRYENVSQARAGRASANSSRSTSASPVTIRRKPTRRGARGLHKEPSFETPANLSNPGTPSSQDNATSIPIPIPAWRASAPHTPSSFSESPPEVAPRMDMPVPYIHISRGPPVYTNSHLSASAPVISTQVPVFPNAPYTPPAHPPTTNLLSPTPQDDPYYRQNFSQSPFEGEGSPDPNGDFPFSFTSPFEGLGVDDPAHNLPAMRSGETLPAAPVMHHYREGGRNMGFGYNISGEENVGEYSNAVMDWDDLMTDPRTEMQLAAEIERQKRERGGYTPQGYLGMGPLMGESSNLHHQRPMGGGGVGNAGNF